MRSFLFSLFSFAVLATAMPLCAKEPPKAEKPAPVRLTVVVILASDSHKEINPKLAALAEEVQKKYEDLTGFKLESVLQKSIPVGDSFTFEMVDKQKLKVTIDKAKDKNGRVGLTVTPPGLDAITYTCACDKFFPLVTPYKTKAGEQLIVAILAKPCTGEGP